MIKYDYINNDIFDNMKIGTEFLCIIKDNNWHDSILLKNEECRILIYDKKYNEEVFLGKGIITFVYIKEEQECENNYKKDVNDLKLLCGNIIDRMKIQNETNQILLDAMVFDKELAECWRRYFNKLKSR